MKVGLCMIVKNEAHIIHEALECTLPLIQTFCIVDTGSTDNTIQIIKDFYAAKGIEGTVHEQPWKNFGFNRTQALNLCDGKMDYALVIDADDIIGFPPDGHAQFQDILEKTKPNNCNILIKQGGIEYWRSQIFKCNDGWRYVGVLHEYPSNDKPSNTMFQLSREFWMESRRLGGRNLTGDKARKDIEVLEKGLKDEPDNDRYMFYLAQSYRDGGDHVNAIKYYKQRFHIGRWSEEAWFAAYQVGLSYKHLGNIPKFEYWLQKAHAFRPTRAEPMYHLTEYFRVSGKLFKAYEYCKTGLQITYPKEDVLFVEQFPHKGGFMYEKTVLDYYVHDDKKVGLRDCTMYLLKNSEHMQNVISNIKFYTSAISTQSKPLNFQNPFGDDFRPSAISVLNYPFANCRFVNYLPPTNSQYFTKDGSPIQTKNAYINLETGESVVMTDPQALFDSPVRGIEDLRLYTDGDITRFTATSYREFIKDKISIVSGTYNLETNALENITGILSPTNSACEKNWVHVPGTPDFIYNWSPLRIGQLVDNTLQITKVIETPPIFSLFRGSSPPILFEGDWLILVHFVEYRIPRKYYHCFVRLSKSYTPLAITLPFFFQINAIEYCISVIEKDGNLKCFVSLNDCNPHEVTVEFNSLEWLNI